MRLVGASTAYIQGPFVSRRYYVWLGGHADSLMLFLPITYWIGKVTQNFFIGMNLFTYYLHNFPEIFLILIGSGILIGAVSSILAIRRYLKV
jgi:cell division transport system permease protein